jgi:hypothetical protein
MFVRRERQNCQLIINSSSAACGFWGVHPMPPLRLTRINSVKWEVVTDDIIRQQFADGMVRGFLQLSETVADVETK